MPIQVYLRWAELSQKHSDRHVTTYIVKLLLLQLCCRGPVVFRLNYSRMSGATFKRAVITLPQNDEKEKKKKESSET